MIVACSCKHNELEVPPPGIRLTLALLDSQCALSKSTLKMVKMVSNKRSGGGGEKEEEKEE